MTAPLRPPSKSGYAPPEDDANPAQPTIAIGGSVGLRKKGAGIRAWLLLDSKGQAQVVEAGKHAIMRRTGLPARDLRILDPFLSYPSTVLGRERAIVINLEHIKAIITAQEVLLLNSRDPSVTPFVEDLQRRILRFHHSTKTQEGRVNRDDSEWRDLHKLEEPQSRVASPKDPAGGFPRSKEMDEEGKEDEKQALKNQDGLKVLPFEFVTLEACLEAACSCLENEARTLELEAHPALDKLTSNISTLNLERARQIKSRLVAITGRVQKVRDELEHLLDDEKDMAEMYLTDKKVKQNLENASVSSINEGDGMNDGVLQSDIDDRIRGEISLEAIGGSTKGEDDLQNIENPQERLFGTPNALTTCCAISKHLDVEELEMLLEAYFVQIDGTLNKLSTLREYVDDTEDYINIILDDKQNHLLQMGTVVTMSTVMVNVFGAVATVFNMNVGIELFNNQLLGMRKWVMTVAGGTAGTIFLWVIAVAWYKYKGLLG